MVKMKVCVLASGSKGNSTYIASLNHHILIDIGLTSLATEKRLRTLGVEPNMIDSIFITHSHIDHTAGLKVFIKKYHPTIYLPYKVYIDLKEVLLNAEVVFIDHQILLDTILIESFKTSHDTEDSVGYLITSEGKEIVYVTDTGYISERNLQKITNKDVYIIESNHDVEMLMNGHYPYHIKQRILGDRGHLSNIDSSYYLSKIIGNHTKKVFLAHLSHENNTEKKALDTLYQTLKKKDITFPSISIAKQDVATEVVEV